LAEALRRHRTRDRVLEPDAPGRGKYRYPDEAHAHPGHDIRDPYAAAAVERLVRDRFEDKGRILVRFGNAPKRCIPFQTIEPFRKILRLFGDADTPIKDCEKLEFLGDGQQVVVDGVHPDTGKPYSWFDGAPGQIKHDDLPPISAEEAQAFVDDAARLLVEKFSFHLKPAKPSMRGNGGKTYSHKWQSRCSIACASHVHRDMSRRLWKPALMRG
jgi:hypothetical protein